MGESEHRFGQVQVIVALLSLQVFYPLLVLWVLVTVSSPLRIWLVGGAAALIAVIAVVRFVQIGRDSLYPSVLLSFIAVGVGLDRFLDLSRVPWWLLVLTAVPAAWTLWFGRFAARELGV